MRTRLFPRVLGTLTLITMTTVAAAGMDPDTAAALDAAILPFKLRSSASVKSEAQQRAWCAVPASAEPSIHRPLEVADVTWWNLEALPDGTWRYPGQGAMIRELILARSQAPID